MSIAARTLQISRVSRVSQISRVALGAALVVAVTATALPAAAESSAPQTRRISVAPDGAQADDSSTSPAVSADGRVVAFSSYASNLAPGGTARTSDVFVRDARDGKLRRVTLDGAESSETSSPALSANGRYLTFNADDGTLGGYSVHVRDVKTGKTERVAPALDDGYAVSYGAAAISADGRYVAFDARPTDATPGSADDGSRVYVLDRRTRKAERISHSPDDATGARGCTVGSISADGRKVAYQDSYTNGPRGDDWGDIFVYDRTTKKEVHADATHDGAKADKASTTPLLSADGSTVAFSSYATNLVPGTDPNRGWNPFVRDLRTGTLKRIDGIAPTDISGADGISADGRKLLYSSSGSVSAHYLRDLRSGKDVLATPGLDGTPRGAAPATLSADASTVVFGGYDDAKFVPGDTNGEADIFVRRLR
ncbi:TolB family protein [Streptomyces flavidovirens]|uniref:TolB family protein n=1 Tax=Streptomyces flavidovirens TaxID=67298 RepID=UPI00041A592C|nr:PD40 domain-containing protein [Streptomyces flavidovirens]